jgi:hypothetical protein
MVDPHMSWKDHNTNRQLEALQRGLRELSRQISTFTQLGSRIMAGLDDLRREVEEAKTVGAGAITLLGTIKAKLDEAVASGDMTQVEALSKELSDSTDALAAAVSANTPAEPTPENPPADPPA